MWAFVLGLGGWFAGALVALIALPSVPIDAAVLVVSAWPLPVALGGLLGLARRPTGSPASTAGLAAAVAGALLGAWLGFDARPRCRRSLTTLVGAVAGTNLALIAYDIVAETKRRPSTPVPAEPIREWSGPLVGQFDRVGVGEQHRHTSPRTRGDERRSRRTIALQPSAMGREFARDVAEREAGLKSAPPPHYGRAGCRFGRSAAAAQGRTVRGKRVGAVRRPGNDRHEQAPPRPAHRGP